MQQGEERKHRGLTPLAIIAGIQGVSTSSPTGEQPKTYTLATFRLLSGEEGSKWVGEEAEPVAFDLLAQGSDPRSGLGGHHLWWMAVVPAIGKLEGSGL